MLPKVPGEAFLILSHFGQCTPTDAMQSLAQLSQNVFFERIPHALQVV